MTKSELINKAAKSVNRVVKKDAAAIIDAVFSSIKTEIKKNKRFSMPDFGTFNVRKRKARKGRNPQTGEEIKIKASKTVTFKPTPKFKESL
ncbi:MAG: HU family DNA-binding protein [Nitrospirota bacterium]